MLVVALALGGAGSQPGEQTPAQPSVLPAVTVTPPPATSAATTATCAQVISALPLVLAGQNLRETTSSPPTGLVQAWGDPPIVFRCGVAKPAILTPAMSDQYQIINHRMLAVVTESNGSNVWTIVDRAVFVEVDVPAAYQGSAVLPPVADAVYRVLPRPVCVAENFNQPDQMCTRR